MNVNPFEDNRTEAKHLWTLAWPVILGQLGLVSMGTVDVLVVGRLGAEPLAALGIANVISFMPLMFALGVTAGMDPFFTRAFGANRARDAGEAFVRGAWILAILCVPVTLWHLCAGPILDALQQPESIRSDAVIYCAILAARVPSFLIFSLMRQFLQAQHILRPAMWIILLGNVANLVTDVWWVHGGGGVPALGVEGAAWSTLIVSWMMAFALAAWCKAPLLDSLRGIPWRTQPADLYGAARIAFPKGLQVAVEVWAFQAVSIVAGWIGPLALAAHVAAINVASTTFMVPLGFGSATTIRIGNLIGAGHTWKATAWLAISLCAGMMTVSGCLLAVLAYPIAGLYTPDVALIGVIASLLPIAAAFQIFDGIQVASNSVLTGLGDTKTPFIVNLWAHWLIGVPVGALLALRFGFGVQGLWYGLVLGLFLVAVVLTRKVRHARTVAI